MRQLLFLSILIFYSFSFFNPTNQWREILTKHHRFIYPSEYEPIAQQIAWLNEQTYSYYCKHLEIHRKTKWNIVLNNKSFNNAFVTFGAPQYSQFFGGLSSGIFQSIHWNYILTVHEGRHQAQLDKLNYGLIHLAKEIGGERLFQYLAGGSSVAWYMEGEAVNFETRFSQRGRGNIPGFDRNLKAILLERASKNEENIYYKDIEYRKNIYFPNHYVYGYVLASYMIKKYGNEIWDRVLSVNAFVPIPSLGFNFSVLLQAGLPIDFHYKKAMRELTEIYQKQLKSLPITSVNKINPRKKIKKAKNWLNYEFQGEFSNGDLLVKKTSLDRHSELITLNNKKEKVVFKGSFRLSRTDKVNVTGNKAVWSYANIDPLWTSELYADIVLYDHNTKKIKQVTKKSRYFDPFINPEQKKIVAVKYNNGFYFLTLLDIKTGKQLKNIDLGPYQIFNPSWSSDGRHLFYLKTSLNDYRGIGLFMYNIKTAQETTLMDYSTSYGLSHPIHYPQKNAVVFSSDYSGIDNIYLVNISSKKVQQLTSRPYGAYNPSISQNKKDLLFFSDYGGIQGFDTVSIPLIEKDWKVLSQVPIRRINLTAGIDKASEREKIKKISYTFPFKNTKITNGFIATNYYKSKKYHLLKNSINFHSWGLLIDLNRLNRLNLHLESDDLLKTFSTEIVLGYQIYHPFASFGDTASLSNHSFAERLVGDFNLNFTKYPLKISLLNNFQTFRLYPFLNQQNQLSTLLSLPDNIVSGGYTFQRLRNRLILSFPLFFSTPAVRHSLNAALYSSMSFQFGAENLDKIIRDNIDTSRFTTLVPAGKFNFNPGIFLEYVAAGPKQSSTFTLDYSFLPSIFSYYNQVEHSFFLDSRFTFDGFGLYDRFSANIYYEKPNSFTGRRKSLAGNTRLRASIFDSFGVHFRYSTPIVFPNFGIPTLAFIRDIQLNPLIEYNLVRHQNINEVDDIFSVGAEIATDVSFFNLFSADLVFTLYYNILLAEQGIYNENQRISFNFNFRLALSSNHRHL